MGGEAQQSEALKQKMCVRYSQFFGLSDADTWDGLPVETRYFFAAMSYNEIIHPLLWYDMNYKGHTTRQAERIYGVSHQTAWRMSRKVPADLGLVIADCLRSGECC